MCNQYIVLNYITLYIIRSMSLCHDVPHGIPISSLPDGCRGCQVNQHLRCSDYQRCRGLGQHFPRSYTLEPRLSQADISG